MSRERKYKVRSASDYIPLALRGPVYRYTEPVEKRFPRWLNQKKKEVSAVSKPGRVADEGGKNER